MFDDVLMVRVAYARGLYEAAELRAWVDRELARRDVLPPELLELATGVNLRHEEALALLRSLEGERGELARGAAEVAVMAELYRRGRVSLADLVHQLAGLLNHGLPDDHRLAMAMLPMEYESLPAGEGPLRAAFIERLHALLSQYPLG